MGGRGGGEQRGRRRRGGGGAQTHAQATRAGALDVHNRRTVNRGRPQETTAPQGSSPRRGVGSLVVVAVEGGEHRGGAGLAQLQDDGAHGGGCRVIPGVVARRVQQSLVQRLHAAPHVQQFIFQRLHATHLGGGCRAIADVSGRRVQQFIVQRLHAALHVQQFLIKGLGVARRVQQFIVQRRRAASPRPAWREIPEHAPPRRLRRRAIVEHGASRGA